MTIENSDAVSGAAGQALDWRDGDMPYSRAFGDHFYCQEDGRLECGHVFLAGNHLPARWRGRTLFRIGELGFGTGLNVCETWRQWKQTRDAQGRLHVTSFELYPMRAGDIDRALAHWPEIDGERQALVAAWPQNPTGVFVLDLDPQTRLTVVCGPALDGVRTAADGIDAWFLDGFAPSRNGDMWSAELMQAVFARTAKGGRFATYAAAGFVRRNLGAAGFTVERRPGFRRQARNALRRKTCLSGLNRRRRICAGRFSQRPILSSSISGLIGLAR